MLPTIVITALVPAVVFATSFPATTLSQLELGSWLESITVRPNGDLLLTQMYPSADIYTIRNPSGQSHALEQLVSIPAVHKILGIAEVPQSHSNENEKYIVVGGNSSASKGPVTGTFSAWSIEFGCSSCGQQPHVTKVSDMSNESGSLNGVSSIPGVSDAVLVSDSALGLVGHLNISSGVFDTSAFIYSEMSPVEGAALVVGVNGIHIREGYLYFTNSFAVCVYRIAVTSLGYPAEGAKVELVADLSSMVTFIDDFAFDNAGNMYIAGTFGNVVIFHNVQSGESMIVAGSANEMTVAGPTSAKFGRGQKDSTTLYVPTSGALASPVGGNRTEGAKVVSINIGVNNIHSY